MPRTLKAISVRQPDANLIVRKRKTLEVRSWRTNYRGDLLICSTQRPRIEPAGMALAIVEVFNCRPMRRRDEKAACCTLDPGAYVWELRNIRPIKPFPVKGRLGFFAVQLPARVYVRQK